MAVADITPPIGYRMCGYFYERLSTGVHDPLHAKAIYLHQGQQYYVHQLDIPERRAYVKQVDSDYFTDAITYTKVKVLETMETAAEPLITPPLLLSTRTNVEPVFMLPALTLTVALPSIVPPGAPVTRL